MAQEGPWGPVEQPRSSGFKIGSFAGAGVYLDPSMLVLALYVLASGADARGTHLIESALFLAALLLTVLLHEFGHASAAALLGIPSKSIVLTFFGGHVEFALPPKTRWQSIVVSAAGPLTNLFTCLALYLAIPWLVTLPDAARIFASNLAYASLILGVFNLLPGFPLDGGSIARSALSYLMRPQVARLIVAWTGLVIAAVLGLYAAMTQLWWTLFIGLFLALSAWAEINRASAALKAQPPEPTMSNA